jgi:hypothetical protein
MRRIFLGLVVLVAACGGDKNESETDASTGASSTGGEESGATLGMSSQPTTDGAGGTTGDSGTEAGEVTSNGEGTGMGPTSADPSDPTGTTGVCETLCMHADECGVDLGGRECQPQCSDALDSDAPGCPAATSAMLECLIGLGCPEFKDAVENDSFGECSDELAAQEEACAGEVCESSVGGNEDGTECSLTQICPESTLELDCDATTCTCTIDGEPAGMCAAEGVCVTLEGLDAKADACCGG